MRSRTWFHPPLSFALFLIPAGAQTSAPATVAPLTYDAVSIRPNKSGAGNINWRSTPGGFVASNITLKMLIVSAYEIREGLVFGLPAWAESGQFDINAKVTDADPELLKKQTPEQERALMAKMLADRFGLKVHTEMKTLPVYDLVIAKGGSRLKEYVAPPEETGPAKPRTGMALGNLVWNRGEMAGVAVLLSVVVKSLEGDFDRSIIDRTGLTGKYDFHLVWNPESSGSAGGDASAAPPLLTALQEQLGLKLVPTKGPVATLVVDHIEHPSEN